MKTLDFYDSWYNCKEDTILAPRETGAISLIRSLHLASKARFLDAGCGRGTFMKTIVNEFGFDCSGAEYSKKAVAICKEQGMDVKFSDLNESLDFETGSFDIVYAGEVIEHLFDPDKFLEECNRVLKTNGHLVITTPNLCCWYNRILMLFGMQPIFIETSTRSKMVGAGLLGKLKQDPYPVGHVRIFNYASLQDILKLYGFEIINSKGEVFEYFPKKLNWLEKLFCLRTKFASNMIIVAVKK